MTQTCPDLILIHKTIDPHTPTEEFFLKKQKKKSANKTRFPAPCNSSLPLHTGGHGGKTFGSLNAINQIIFGTPDV